MKCLAAFSSGCVLAAVLFVAPAPAHVLSNFAQAGTTPSDQSLFFRKYRGDDEVGDRDHSGRGNGGGGGGGGDGDRGGGRNSGGGGKDKAASGGGGKGNGSGGNPRDGGDRFGN